MANILKRAGLDPAPERRRTTSRKEFLRSHRETLAAADLFTAEVWTAVGLVRYHIFFVMRLSTRHVHIAGIIPEPRGPWMKQIARNLIDGFDGFLNECGVMTPIDNRLAIALRNEPDGISRTCATDDQRGLAVD